MTSTQGTIQHRRLGHPHTRTLELIKSCGLIPYIPISKDSCIFCGLGKSSRCSFHTVEHNSKFPLELIHAYVWQPLIPCNMGLRYYVIFVDKFSRMFWLIRKYEVFHNFCLFKTAMENLFGNKIKYFQCDGGAEFNNSNFINLFQELGISLCVPCPYTPTTKWSCRKKALSHYWDDLNSFDTKQSSFEILGGRRIHYYVSNQSLANFYTWWLITFSKIIWFPTRLFHVTCLWMH